MEGIDLSPMPDLPSYIVISARNGKYVLLKTSHIIRDTEKFWKFELVPSPQATSGFAGNVLEETYEYSHCRESSRHEPVYYKNTMTRTGRYITMTIGIVNEYKMTQPNRNLPSGYCRISLGQDTTKNWCFEPVVLRTMIPQHILRVFVRQ